MGWWIHQLNRRKFSSHRGNRDFSVIWWADTNLCFEKMDLALFALLLRLFPRQCAALGDKSVCNYLWQRQRDLEGLGCQLNWCLRRTQPSDSDWSRHGWFVSLTAVAASVRGSLRKADSRQLCIDAGKDMITAIIWSRVLWRSHSPVTQCLCAGSSLLWRGKMPAPQ